LALSLVLQVAGVLVVSRVRFIKKQLESLVSQIKLRVNVDQVHFRNKVVKLKKELNNKQSNFKLIFS